MTLYNSLIDIQVIHAKYMLGTKHLLNVFIHQFIIMTAMIGAFFTSRTNIQAHLFLVLVSIACMLFFKACFMAEWQRKNIPYMIEDLLIIHKSERRRVFDFLLIIVPVLLIDLFKLSRM